MLRSLLRALKNPAEEPLPRPEVPVVATQTASPLEPAHEAAPEDVYQAATRAEQRGDPGGATAIFRAHTAAHPDDFLAIATLGGHLLQLQQLEPAEEVLLPALRHFPDAAPLLFNAGRAAQMRMRTDEAIRLYRLALAAEPGFAMARFVISLQLPLKGEYRETFLLMRSRNELSATPSRAWPRDVPYWNGESLHGKRLLVWLEWGGLGDEIQFARYLEPLARDYRPARLVLGCSREGKRLYARIPGVDEAFSEAGNVAVDFQIALMDLPIIYKTTLDNMLPARPYLTVPTAEAAPWAARLAAMHGRKIGLCWSSGFWGQRTRSDKSIPLDLLNRLAEFPEINFISLQKGPGREEMPCPGLTIHDFDADLVDLADTAALVENLDLVISVDTSVAHLAGALGKPVIMLLKWESGNFWLLQRADSPWYPTMRIVRQPASGDWKSVADQLFALLSGWAWAEPRSAPPPSA